VRLVRTRRRLSVLAAAVALLGACSAGRNSGVGAASTNASTIEPTSIVEPSSSATTTASTLPVPPALLPGDAWIVYEGPLSDGHGSVGNRLVRPDGKDDHWATPQVALPKNGWQVHPDWNPDGTRLAFAADDTSGDGTRDIWVSQPDGTAAERLLDCDLHNCLQADDPAWSPDGTTLAFDAAYDMGGGVIEWRLVLIDVSTKAITTGPTANGSDEFALPRWSSDGHRLVFELSHWTNALADGKLIATAVAVVDLHERNPVPKVLTDWSMSATYPDWHPKEDLIVFSTRRWSDLDEGPSNLYTIRPDGSHLTPLTTFAKGETRAVQPSWTPEAPASSSRRSRGLASGSRRWRSSVATARACSRPPRLGRCSARTRGCGQVPRRCCQVQAPAPCTSRN
jgi:dipeptidyl aminopeptidase/acylaminoacyl peptidase